MMIKPSIEQLTKGEINRYELVIATAKCARIVTDEYVEQREKADKLVANKMTDKPISSLIDNDLRNKKAVENAVQRIYSGEYKIILPKQE
ncbi:MAG: DNA-directed RNA polymerase subunit omega [Clostridia bacterium]|nr:DNA-directed RNA polymerase subunit omega [Clostridia bacterium]